LNRGAGEEVGEGSRVALLHTWAAFQFLSTHCFLHFNFKNLQEGQQVNLLGAWGLTIHPGSIHHLGDLCRGKKKKKKEKVLKFLLSPSSSSFSSSSSSSFSFFLSISLTVLLR